MKSHPLVPWEQQIGAEEQGKIFICPGSLVVLSCGEKCEVSKWAV